MVAQVRKVVVKVVILQEQTAGAAEPVPVLGFSFGSGGGGGGAGWVDGVIGGNGGTGVAGTGSAGGRGGMVIEALGVTVNVN